MDSTFKINETIICIDGKHNYLTEDGEYMVLGISKQGHPYVRNDHGVKTWYHTKRFVSKSYIEAGVDFMMDTNFGGE